MWLVIYCSLSFWHIWNPHKKSQMLGHQARAVQVSRQTYMTALGTFFAPLFSCSFSIRPGAGPSSYNSLLVAFSDRNETSQHYLKLNCTDYLFNLKLLPARPYEVFCFRKGNKFFTPYKKNCNSFLLHDLTKSRARCPLKNTVLRWGCTFFLWMCCSAKRLSDCSLQKLLTLWQHVLLPKNYCNGKHTLGLLTTRKGHLYIDPARDLPLHDGLTFCCRQIAIEASTTVVIVSTVMIGLRDRWFVW